MLQFILQHLYLPITGQKSPSPPHICLALFQRARRVLPDGYPCSQLASIPGRSQLRYTLSAHALIAPQESWGSRYLSKLLYIYNDVIAQISKITQLLTTFMTQTSEQFCCDGLYFCSALAQALSSVENSRFVFFCTVHMVEWWAFFCQYLPALASLLASRRSFDAISVRSVLLAGPAVATNFRVVRL